MSTEEMKFMDAGYQMKSPEPTSPKVYPRFSVDLDQFPDLEADVDESIELHLKGRVCSVEHSDYCHRMEVEVMSVAVPDHSHKTEYPKNEADIAMEKMKSLRRIG